MITKQSKVGFAIAIFELAKEEKKINKIYKEIKQIQRLIDENPMFISMMNDLSLEFNEKSKTLKLIFKKFDPIIVNAMMILTENNRFNYLNDIISLLIESFEKEMNIKEAIVYSTYKISEKELKELSKKLSKLYNVKINLTNLIDQQLIGGFKIVIGDTIIEDSVKSDLSGLRKNLLFNKGEI